MGDITCKIKIDGGEYLEFAKLNVSQNVGMHHTFVLNISLKPESSILLTHANNWLGKIIEVNFVHTNVSVYELISSEEKSNSFVGFVQSVAQARGAGMSNYIVLKGYSTSGVLNDGLHTRSFTDLSLQEIVDTVISPYAIQFNADDGDAVINPNYKDTIPYLVQYKETNFQFLTRIAAEYGEWFFYNGTKLCFGALNEDDDDVVNFSFGTEDLLNYELLLQSSPVLFKYKGYDYISDEHPEIEPSDSGEMNDYAKVAFDKSKKEIYPQSNNWVNVLGHGVDENELNRYANRHYQNRIHEMLILKGASKNPYVKLGTKLMLEDIETGDDHGEYVVYCVNHQANENGNEYVNFFEAVPVEVLAPPIMSNIHTVFCEAQQAIVTATNDPQGLGRVKVRFFWQNGTNEESPWIRVGSLGTGPNKGLFMIPEIDDLVWVDFENGSPDRPFVLSGFFHGKTKPSWQDDKNNVKALITRSGNAVTLDDAEGKETVTISNPCGGNTIKMTADGDVTVSINSSKSLTVTSVEDVTIAGKNISLNAEENVSVAGQVVSLAGNEKVAVSATEIKIADKGADSISLKDGSVGISGASEVGVGAPFIKLNS